MLYYRGTVQRGRAENELVLGVALVEKYLLCVSIYWSMNYNCNGAARYMELLLKRNNDNKEY